MNEPPQLQVQQLIRDAYLAVRQGKRLEARQLATQAARLAPELEEPWLILAALAEAKTALEYLNRALAINPASERARKGIAWAGERLQKEQAASMPSASPPPPLPPLMQPALAAASPAAALPFTPPVASSSGNKLFLDGVNWRLVLPIALAGVLILALGALAAWPAVATAFARNSSAAKPAAVLFKPSLTFTPTNTVTSTATFTSTSTFTPTYTNTATVTHTPDPSKTPQPTKTRLPTLTRTRGATQVSKPSLPTAISGRQRWIDVDLGKQRAYAYEGSSLIRSFVISTGLARYPTPKGQFHIYVKYRYANMSGPGYFLPNVPYTMYFYSGYGLHGTYWHNNFGTPMSHGCVNFRTEDAGWLFNWASVGTLVNIH